MGKGRTPCCDKSQVKRGPWSPAEDLKLITFIQKYGHENWRALPKQAGLMRCGKSCRLRWINYLRPDVKRGKFTREEEETVIKLHQTWGNKWSRIASQLPGRTDNEIKNVWNTYLKKKIFLGSKHPTEKSNESYITSSSSSSSSTVTSNTTSKITPLKEENLVVNQNDVVLPTLEENNNNNNNNNHDNDDDDDDGGQGEGNQVMELATEAAINEARSEEVNKPDMMMTMMMMPGESDDHDQIIDHSDLLEFPLDQINHGDDHHDDDFWKFLDGFGSFPPNPDPEPVAGDGNSNHHEVGEKITGATMEVSAVDNHHHQQRQDWLRYLEQELELADGNGDGQIVKINTDHDQEQEMMTNNNNNNVNYFYHDMFNPTEDGDHDVIMDYFNS